MRSFTRVCRIYVTVLHYISEGAIALFYYTNLHLMVIFNTYKCADWRKFLIFTDITKQKTKKTPQRSAYSMNARSPMNPVSKAKEKLDFRSVSN